MAWPESTLSDVRFNPWPVKYLMTVEKWFPLYWPNAEWEVVSFPPAFDELGNRLAPKLPDGTVGPWWKMLPKDQWPIQAPWEPKVFGAWPSSQISMPEDLVNHPPFGYINLKVPGQRITSGNEIPFTNMRIHMRPDLGPIHHMRIMTRNTPMGQKFYLIDRNWDHYEYDWREYRAAMRAKRQERFRELLAIEIARTKGQPKPTRDLFS